MSELVLVRHAATAWSGRRYCGSSDPPLNTTGRAAAARLAMDLRSSLRPGIPIVSSPRRRAVETARAIAAAVGSASIELDERWAEADFGVAEGLTYEELAAAHADIAARLVAGAVDIDWPEGEPAAALVARVEAAWRDVVRRAPHVLVVTHGGPMRAAIALATGRPAAGVVAPPPAGVWRLAAAPGSHWPAKGA